MTKIQADGKKREYQPKISVLELIISRAMSVGLCHKL